MGKVSDTGIGVEHLYGIALIIFGDATLLEETYLDAEYNGDTYCSSQRFAIIASWRKTPYTIPLGQISVINAHRGCLNNLLRSAAFNEIFKLKGM